MTGKGLEDCIRSNSMPTFKEREEKVVGEKGESTIQGLHSGKCNLTPDYYFLQ